MQYSDPYLISSSDQPKLEDTEVNHEQINFK